MGRSIQANVQTDGDYLKQSTIQPSATFSNAVSKQFNYEDFTKSVKNNRRSQRQFVIDNQDKDSLCESTVNVPIRQVKKFNQFSQQSSQVKQYSLASKTLTSSYTNMDATRRYNEGFRFASTKAERV